MNLVLRFSRILPFAALAAVPLMGSAACNAQIATVLSSDAGAGDPSVEGGSGGAACTADPDCNDDPSMSALAGSCTGGVCSCRPGFTRKPNGKCGTSTTTSGNCVAKGGMCISGESKPPAGHRAAGAGEATCPGDAVCYLPIVTGPGPVCVKDQDCNNDASVSALWGKCFFGVCMCDPTHTVQANGKCDAPTAPDCMAQKGTCRQMPAECQASELGSAQSTNMSCGDFVAAVCCNDAKLCNGPARELAGGGYSPVAFVCCPGTDATLQPICVNGWKTCPGNSTPLEKASCPGG